MKTISLLLSVSFTSVLLLTGCCGPRCCTPAVCYLPAPCAVPGAAVCSPHPCEQHVPCLAAPPQRFSEPMHPAFDLSGQPYLIPQSRLGGVLDAAAAAAPAGP